jgi:hypothetical protein
MTVTNDIKTDRYGTPDQAPEPASVPLAASTIVYAGTIALVNSSGYLKASDSPLTTDACMGIVSKQTDNRATSFAGGALGAIQAPVDRGTFWLNYDPSNAPTNPATWVQTVYVKDAQTVSTSSAAGPVAGIVKAVDTSISKCAVALGTNAGTIF